MRVGREQSHVMNFKREDSRLTVHEVGDICLGLAYDQFKGLCQIFFVNIYLEMCFCADERTCDMFFYTAGDFLRKNECKNKQQEAHRSPEITVQINKHI